MLGVPDPKWGESGHRGVAWPGRVRAWRRGALRDFLGDKISRYKMPKRFVFWDEMPKSAYGKIAKKLNPRELQRRGDLEPCSRTRRRRHDRVGPECRPVPAPC